MSYSKTKAINEKRIASEGSVIIILMLSLSLLFTACSATHLNPVKDVKKAPDLEVNNAVCNGDRTECANLSWDRFLFDVESVEETWFWKYPRNDSAMWAELYCAENSVDPRLFEVE